jgi:hypothetical protein
MLKEQLEGGFWMMIEAPPAKIRGGFVVAGPPDQKGGPRI